MKTWKTLQFKVCNLTAPNFRRILENADTTIPSPWDNALSLGWSRGSFYNYSSSRMSRMSIMHFNHTNSSLTLQFLPDLPTTTCPITFSPHHRILFPWPLISAILKSQVSDQPLQHGQPNKSHFPGRVSLLPPATVNSENVSSRGWTSWVPPHLCQISLPWSCLGFDHKVPFLMQHFIDALKSPLPPNSSQIPPAAHPSTTSHPFFYSF